MINHYLFITALRYIVKTRPDARYLENWQMGLQVYQLLRQMFVCLHPLKDKRAGQSRKKQSFASVLAISRVLQFMMVNPGRGLFHPGIYSARRTILQIL